MSSNHVGLVDEVFAAKWARGCHGVGEFVVGTLAVVDGVLGTRRYDGHFLAVCP